MKKFVPTDRLNQVLRTSGSMKKEEALNATAEFAKALELPLRQGVLSGDILNGIFEPIQLQVNATPEFPLDFIAPGSEKDYVAYTIPNHGYIPQRNVEGDYVMVPVYDIGASIDWNLKYARDARWDVIGRAMEVFQAQFVKKLNDDGWHTIFANWLKTSNLAAKDAIMVFSVGGGNAEKNVSVNIINALKLAKSQKAKIIGIVGRDGGYTAQVADACVVVPIVNLANVTPHTEAFQAVVWHLIVSHPKFQAQKGKWESTK